MSMSVAPLEPCFNSKLVRLKVERLRQDSNVTFSFNSKLVRLKVIWNTFGEDVPNSFNSKLVRLKALWLLIP